MQDNTKSLFSILGLISLSLMFFLPFTVAYHKWPEPNYYSQLLAIVLGLLSLTVFFKPATKSLSFPITALVPAVLSLVLAIQWFAGVGYYWHEVALGILYLWWALLLMLTTRRLKAIYGTEVMVRWLAYAILFGGLFNAVVVLMQLLGTDQFFWTFPLIGKSYSGNLAQVNHLTNYTSLAITSLLYLSAVGRIKVRLLVLLLFLFLIVLSLTGSRMSWLYVLMITASFFFFARGLTSNNKRFSKWVIFLPLMYGFVQVVLPLVVNAFSPTQALPPLPAERVVTLATEQSARLTFLALGFDMFKLQPWLGVGWGQFPWYDLLWADQYTGHRGFSEHSHNLFMQALAECGIFAFLTLFLGSLYWFLQIFKQESSMERWWIILVAGIIFMHSMLEYPLWYSYFLGLFVVVVALGDKDVKLNLMAPLLPSALAAITCIACLNLVVTTTQQYKQVEYWVNVYPQLSKQQRFEMLNDMSALLEHTLVAEPLHLVLTRAYSILPRKQAPLEVKIAKYETVLHYVQAKEDIYRYIFLLAADGQVEKAKMYLRRAYVRQPKYAKQFEAQIQKGVRRNDASFIALQEELSFLQAKER